MTPDEALALAEDWEKEALAEQLAAMRAQAPIVQGLLDRNAPREEWEEALGVTFPPVIRDPDGPNGERRGHSTISKTIWIETRHGTDEDD
jgi:hypothetical protein